jgi:hypothetical protein
MQPIFVLLCKDSQPDCCVSYSWQTVWNSYTVRLDIAVGLHVDLILVNFLKAELGTPSIEEDEYFRLP